MISIKGLDGLTVRDLAALVALGDRLHFGQAARDCGIAQPSISAIVKKAEAGLGFSLFLRSPRKVEPTEDGRRVLAAIADALETLRTAHPKSQSTSLWDGTFRLGIIPTLGPYLLPQILPALRRDHPQIEWELAEAKTVRLAKMVLDDRLDAALVSLPTDVHGLEEMPLFREELVLAVPAGHRLALARRVGIGEIDPREMIHLERGHCLREDVLRQCASSVAARTTHAASLEIQRLMVKAGSGCAVFPAMAAAWDRSTEGVIRYVPFDAPSPARTIGLAFRMRHAHAGAVRSLGAKLRSLPIQSRFEPEVTN